MDPGLVLHLVIFPVLGGVVGGLAVALLHKRRRGGLVADVERLDLKPGDQLLLKVDRPLTKEMVERIREQCEELFDGTKVAVLESGLDVSVFPAQKVALDGAGVAEDVMREAKARA